jgi:pyrroloquinoline quinone biosynthesis protein B
MHIIVLGAAAGGGFPQWNCHSPASRRARAGDPAAMPRTQASIAVSGDGQRWTLINAAPDIREQIAHTPQLHPRTGLRSSPIAAVVLTGGDVDVIAGLLTLRERQPFALFASPQVMSVLDDNPIFEVLARDLVERQIITLDRSFALPCGVSATIFPVPGKVPLYLEQGDGPQPVVTDGTTVGVMLTNGKRRVAYIPGCAAIDDVLRERLTGLDMLFFDGTLWRDDEMILAGLGQKTGRRMGHVSLGGPEGTIAALSGIPVGRRVAIHINNSNPVLLDDSPERLEAEAAGWTIPVDGMSFDLSDAQHHEA